MRVHQKSRRAVFSCFGGNDLVGFVDLEDHKVRARGISTWHTAQAQHRHSTGTAPQHNHSTITAQSQHSPSHSPSHSHSHCPSTVAVQSQNNEGRAQRHSQMPAGHCTTPSWPLCAIAPKSGAPMSMSGWVGTTGDGNRLEFWVLAVGTWQMHRVCG